MKLERLIGQFKAYTEYPNQDTFVVSNQECVDILKYLKQVPKTGHWIDDNKDEIDAQYGRHLYRCQICNKYADYFVGGTEDWWDVEKPNYCPNCGCRMESEE